MNNLVVFTMEGCPHCLDSKKMLKENKIDFHEMDIEKNNEEYSMFVEITKNDFVPAFMIVSEEEKPEFFTPDDNFQDLDEAITIIKNKL